MDGVDGWRDEGRDGGMDGLQASRRARSKQVSKPRSMMSAHLPSHTPGCCWSVWFRHCLLVFTWCRIPSSHSQRHSFKSIPLPASVPFQPRSPIFIFYVKKLPTSPTLALLFLVKQFPISSGFRSSIPISRTFASPYHTSPLSSTKAHRTMADKNLKEGDEGGSSTSSVRKNADPKNPAVHATRDGNDVVKRASELTKGSADITNDSAASSTAAEAAEPNNANGEKKEVEIGEKRDRVEGEEKPAAQELAEAEKDAGKEAKKPKLAEGAEGGNSGASNGGDDTASPPKKRGPGRPKKSEKEAKKRDEAAKPEASTAETISGRTRSKAS